MKYRLYLVSNSSSSSWICLVSGNVESGMDISLEDAGMYRCENDHTFGEDYLVNYNPQKDKDKLIQILATEDKLSLYKSSFKSLYQYYDDEDIKANLDNILDHYEANGLDDAFQFMVDIHDEIREDSGDDRYETPSENCPICDVLQI